MKDGEPFTDGFETLRLPRGPSATLEKIELVGADGLELLGAKVASPPRKYAYADYIPGWPPRFEGEDAFIADAEIVDLAGARVDRMAGDEYENQGYELLLGLRITDPHGYGTRTGLKLTYRIGLRSYVVKWNADLAACSKPESYVDGQCPPNW